MTPFGGPRHARRRDDNEDALILDGDRFASHRFFDLGVQKLDEKGVPDLLLGLLGRNFIIEVKNPEGNSPAQKVLTPAQKKWWHAWPGQKEIAETPADMRRIISHHEAAAHVERLAPLVADAIEPWLEAPHAADVAQGAIPFRDIPIPKLREFVKWTRALQETSP